MKIKHTTPFTMIENKLIRSKELTIYQKLVYIALCSYANDENICFPSYKTIAEAVGCSRRKVIDTIKELVEQNMILKRKPQNTASNEYEIVIKGESPAPTDAKDAPKRGADSATSGHRPAPKEYPNKNNKEFNHNHPSISRYDADAMEQLIKKNIVYDTVIEASDKDQVDGIIAIMVDTICGTSPTVRIGGSDFPREVVRSRLLKLNEMHIQYVKEVMGKNTTKIRNIRAYLLTALYNAPATMDSYYWAEVNHDLYGVE